MNCKLKSICFIFISIIILISTPIYAGDWSIDEYNNIKQGISNECFNNQIKRGQDELFEDWQIRKYCDCCATKMLERISYDEFKEAYKNKRYTPSMKQEILSVGEECAHQILE